MHKSWIECIINRYTDSKLINLNIMTWVSCQIIVDVLLQEYRDVFVKNETMLLLLLFNQGNNCCTNIGNIKITIYCVAKTM